ncbi:nucleotidyltransferase domain-containing protein [Lyngbya confervoides]|uniref:Nucleotidyltransferase family protein n=1 Tax=Lyngbya confervoides BDU141951 TaxID=1574623 RepID=A0ABD4T8Q8_9CYAN|nr:nucleotidyltransferase family protein [Lyngbya confervoides]MCM1984833.1 nucleotidyltransferase family protein [Lyngbya confervoides BDU141951]
MSISPTPLSSPSPLRGEIRLLLACAGLHLVPDHRTTIAALLDQGLDWEYVLRTAARHRITPLLFQGLAQGCPERVPKAITAYLKQRYHLNHLKNLFLTHQLKGLLQLFQQQQVPVLAYKGPVLAQMAYGNLALREFCDLDLLVHPDQFCTAQAVLEGAGYTQIMNLSWENQYASADQQVNIDLHRRLCPDYFYLPDEFINPQQDRPSLESWFLLLCIQIGKDCCHWKLCLSQLFDLAELWRSHPDLEFALVQEQARALGCHRLLWMSICLIQEVLAFPLPPAVQAQLIDQRVAQDLAQQVQQKLWYEVDHPKPRRAEVGFWEFFRDLDHRFYLRIRERPRDRLRYAWHWLWKFIRFSLTPNQADRNLVRLPPYLSFLYCPIHVIRLILKYGWFKAVARAKRDRHHILGV